MIQPWKGVSPTIDASAWVHPDSTLIGNVAIGAESSIWPQVTIRGDDNPIVIGSQTSIQDGSVVHLTESLSETRVGNRVTVGHNVTLHGCIVEDDVIVGMGSILLDNARVGRGTIIGAGTLVPMNKTVPSGVLVLGNPFRVVRDLTAKDREWIEFSWKSYVEKARVWRSSAAG